MESIIREIMSKVGVTQDQAKQAFEIAVSGLKDQLPKEAVKHIDKLLGTSPKTFFSQLADRLEQLRETLEEASAKGETKVDELRTKFQELKTEAESRIEELKTGAKEKVEAAKEKAAAEETVNSLAPETAVVVTESTENEANTSAEVLAKTPAAEPKTETTNVESLQEKGAALLEDAKEKLGDVKEVLEEYQEKGKEKLEEVKELIEEQKENLLLNLKKGAMSFIDRIIPEKEEAPKSETSAPATEVTIEDDSEKASGV